MEKIIVPEVITRDWLTKNNFVGCTDYKGTKLMEFLHTGALTKDETKKIVLANYAFNSEDATLRAKEEANKKTTKRLKNIATAIAIIPEIANVVKSWDGKIYDSRFNNAIKSVIPWVYGKPYLSMHLDYGEWGVSLKKLDSEEITLIWVSNINDILTPRENRKKRRVNAASIIAALDAAVPKLEEEAAKIKKTAAEIKKIRILVEERRKIKDKILAEYDLKTIADYDFILEHELSR